MYSELHAASRPFCVTSDDRRPIRSAYVCETWGRQTGTSFPRFLLSNTLGELSSPVNLLPPVPSGRAQQATATSHVLYDEAALTADGRRWLAILP
jgi:hypothetical protein